MGKRRCSSDPVLADEHRCTRNDGKSWRCYSPRHGATLFCQKHHISYLAKLSKIASHRRTPPISNPQTIPISPPSKIGQVWAFIQHSSSRNDDNNNNIAIHYARIDHQTPSSVIATPLLPHPVLDEDILAAESGRTLSCGTFRPSPKERAISLHPSALAFLVPTSPVIHWMGAPFFKIYPNKDQVWAVSSASSSDVKLVEILSDFTEDEGVTVAGLVPDGGTDGGDGTDLYYKRQMHEGFRLIQTFGRREMMAFSFRVPASPVEGSQGDLRMWKVLLQSKLQLQLLHKHNQVGLLYQHRQ